MVVTSVAVTDSGSGSKRFGSIGFLRLYMENISRLSEVRIQRTICQSAFELLRLQIHSIPQWLFYSRWFVSYLTCHLLRLIEKSTDFSESISPQ